MNFLRLALALVFAATAAAQTSVTIQNQTRRLQPQIPFIVFPPTAIRMDDTNASHQLVFVNGSDLTANRTFTVKTGDVSMEVDFSGAGVGSLLIFDGTKWLPGSGGAGTGTVTSVDVATANGVSATGGPITGSGSFTFSLGAITPTTVRGLTITTTTGTFTLTNAKVFSVSNTLTLTGTDGSTLAIGTGGTLGTGAYQPQTVLTGTANEVTVSGGGVGATTLSIPSTFIPPGSVAAVGAVSGSNLSGTNTGDQTSVSGNAGTATALATTRTIGGSNFDGTANVTSFPVPGAIGGTTPAAGAFTTISGTTGTFSSLTSGRVPFVSTAGLLVDSSAFTFSAGTLTVTTVAAALTGNASTATALATARNINGVAFDGSTNITVTAAGSTLSDTVTVAKGGTGATTLTGSLIGNGTSAVTAATSSTVGQVYRVTGSNTFAFGAVDLADTDAVTGVLPIANIAAIVEKIAVFSVDGGGAAIATGTVAGTARIPFACTLTGYSITATAATGTNTIKIWLKATATSIPTISDVINTSGVSLTTGTAVASATLSDFTDTVYAAGDMARCAVTAVDGAATDLTVTLYGTRL